MYSHAASRELGPIVDQPGAGDDDPAGMYLDRLAASGRRSQRHALDTIAAMASGGRHDRATLRWADLGPADTTRLRQRLLEAYQPATVRRMLSALRGVLRCAWQLGELDAEQLARALDVPAVRGDAAPAGRAVTDADVERVFAATDPMTTAGARDRALLAVLFGAGVRSAESAALAVADWRPAGPMLVVRSGKGRKARELPVSADVAGHLSAWLDRRGVDPGPLLTPVDRADQVEVRALTGDAVARIVRRLHRAAGVAAFSPHDCRRRYITGLLDAGVDVLVVQRLAGHRDLRTTARYDRRGDDARRDAADKVRIPTPCHT